MMKTNSPFDLIPEEASSTRPRPPEVSSSGVSTSLDQQSRLLHLASVAAAVTQPQTTTFQDFALHQHLAQVKQHQMIQRQFLEQHLQRNREFQVEHERQLSALLHQAHLKTKEDQDLSPASSDGDRQERLRLEILKQKSSQEQSAVASPEVKRHLAEFVLQKRRKEASKTSSPSSTSTSAAAASMSNLKMMVPNSAVTLHQNQPILRKTASESNLLKMKNRRSNSSSAAAAPYHHHNHHHRYTNSTTHPPSIPETSAVIGIPGSGSGSSGASSTKSHTSSPPVGEVTSALFHDLVLRTNAAAAAAAASVASSPNNGSSEPGSPKLYQQQHHHILQQHPKHQRSLESQQAVASSSSTSSSSFNSKSLPNIPSAMTRTALKETLVKRMSPPLSSSPTTSASTCSSSSSQQTQSGQRQSSLPHHGAMIVRRSKSSAILPLRKHLMEKTMQEKKSSMDEEQFYYQQKQEIARERMMIRPIEEVMEEDLNTGGKTGENMEVDEQPIEQQQRQYLHSFTARLGPLGLSPLVLGEVGGYAQEYVNRLLPRQPLNLAVSNSDQTGLGYDPLMLRHQCICENSHNHPEHPGRVLAVWTRLVEAGLAEQCVRVARRATLEEIRSCHTEAHTLVYGTDMVNRCSLTGSQELHREAHMGKFCQLECGGVGVDSDTYWNELETPAAVRTAVGTMIELSQKVARNELKNGFAIIRPPGHHAEPEEAMGFCYFNSVAIAAKQLKGIQGISRILIIDWAIHHGNGTQKAFYDDPDVLYISLHRHDQGNFYPGTGSPVECGNGTGLGFNVNIAWAGGLDPPMGDAEYLAAFRAIVMPIARQFGPDIVLVSAGFDASAGHPHPIGGYLVSTACFAYMTLQLQQLARGRVVLALEGGFNLSVLGEASEQCVRALLGLPIQKISEAELARRPCRNATETLQKCLAIHTPYWDNLKNLDPETALLSHLEAWEKSKEDTEALDAMAGLSVEQRN